MSNGKNPVSQGVSNFQANALDDISGATQGGNPLAAGEPTILAPGETLYDDQVSETDAKGMSQAGGLVTKATQSIFNPFTVFRYHRFGPFIDGEYKKSLHYDKNLYGSTTGTGFNSSALASGFKHVTGGDENTVSYYSQGKTGGGESGAFELFQPGDDGKQVENPTARRIIEWAKSQDSNKAWSYGPTPYSATDFVYCKYYGKIPNNRLVTLRRYPFPIDDNARMLPGKGPAIPLAQAVTWFGEDVDNPLSSILDIQWDLLWKERVANVWDVDGNEIIVDDLLDGLGIDGSKSDFIKALVASSKGKDENTLELVGHDKVLQDYIKGAYKDDGPYWNKVLGPVNVVDRTMMRERGMGIDMFNSKMHINFDYSLRSHSGINPKIAFLDLLSNFLTLTYNNAPFWGGGYRYFERPGLTVNQAGVDKIRSGDVTGGLKMILNSLVQGSGQGFQQIMQQLSGVMMGGTGATPTGGQTSGEDIKIQRSGDTFELTPSAGANTPKLADNFLAGFASSLFKAPLSYQSLLEGRPIGEWHVTVGNPMNPIAVIGNLYVKSVKMTLNETLGMDDFPTEVSFKVELGHGRPRAAQDIESIFNLGNGPMSFTQITPSAAMNTFGAEGSIEAAKKAGITKAGQDGVYPEGGGTQDASNLSGTTDATGAGTEAVSTDINAGQNNAETLKKRVGRHYGDAYGNVELITTYLNQGSTSR